MNWTKLLSFSHGYQHIANNWFQQQKVGFFHLWSVFRIVVWTTLAHWNTRWRNYLGIKPTLRCLLFLYMQFCLPYEFLCVLVCVSRSRRPYRQWMSFCVEDILVQADEVGVIWEEQVQILQGLSQEEALHLVSRARVVRVPHIIDGGVATRGNLRETHNLSNVTQTIH